MLKLALISMAAALSWSSLVMAENAPRVQEPAKISSGVAEGLLTYRVEPVYPEMAKRVNVEGDVVLQVLISKQGTVENWRPISGHLILIQAT